MALVSTRWLRCRRSDARRHARVRLHPRQPPDANALWAFPSRSRDSPTRCSSRRRQLARRSDFLGLTERFAESVVLAKQRLGLRSILYKTEGRRNSARPRGQHVPEELREAAERCNRYDIELYRYAQELFDSIPERRELEFEVEFAALRAAKGEGAIASTAPAPGVSLGTRVSGACCCMRARWCCAWSGRSPVAAPALQTPPDPRLCKLRSPRHSRGSRHSRMRLPTSRREATEPNQPSRIPNAQRRDPRWARSAPPDAPLHAPGRETAMASGDGGATRRQVGRSRRIGRSRTRTATPQQAIEPKQRPEDGALDKVGKRKAIVAEVGHQGDADKAAPDGPRPAHRSRSNRRAAGGGSEDASRRRVDRRAKKVRSFRRARRKAGRRRPRANRRTGCG